MARDFDPNAAAAKGSGIFGLPHTRAESALVLMPVPWEATTSYGGGTSQGPSAILEASRQVDLFDLDVDKPYEPGIHFLPIHKDLLALNARAKRLAKPVIAAGGLIPEKGKKSKELRRALAAVNRASEELNSAVYSVTRALIQEGKIVGIVGGDHSVPLGALQAVAETHAEFGLLHFDAHSDTRAAYEGFLYSHASIMRNALDAIPKIQKLVQIGIRDVCEEEVHYLRDQGERVRAFYDRDLKRALYSGKTWSALCDQIVAELPARVWVTFDIDGLDPKLCPGTGTPVPGGLEFWEASTLLRRVVEAGKTIIGFDLNEVSPGPDGNEWNANVGARVLYKLCAFTLASQGKCRLL